MAYIGRDISWGVFEKQVLTPNSSTTTFTLDYAAGSANSLLVVYSGVVQEPLVAYALSGGGASITFSEAPATGNTLYIIYLGKQIYVARTAGQETTTQSFTGDGSTSNFTMTQSELDPTSIAVYVGGVYQQPTTNYTVSGTTISFTSAPPAVTGISPTAIVVIHNINSTNVPA